MSVAPHDYKESLARLDGELARFYKQQDAASVVFSLVGADQPATFSEFLNNKVMMISMIRQGLPYSLFDTIADFAPFSDKDWAAFLDMSPKSLQRYRSDKRDFKSIHSEKIIEIAEVTNLGLETFGSYDKFQLWLSTPNFALGSVAPFELLKDSYGKDMVISELTRIAHGILA